MQAFWGIFNTKSIDGLPGLQTAHKTEGPMQSAWGNEYMKVAQPLSHGLPASAGKSFVKTPGQMRLGAGSAGQNAQGTKDLDHNLLSGLLTLDHRILFGIFLGVLLSTLMNRIGAPLI